MAWDELLVVIPDASWAEGPVSAVTEARCPTPRALSAYKSPPPPPPSTSTIPSFAVLHLSHLQAAKNLGEDGWKKHQELMEQYREDVLWGARHGLPRL